jgi:hypothetical protein
MNRERNRPGSGRNPPQSPADPRPGFSESNREEEEEEESGGRIEQDEESGPVDRDIQSNRGTPGNQGRRGMDD